MEDNTLIKIMNRSNWNVGYKIPNQPGNAERSLAPGQTIQITFRELEDLSWVPGGMKLIKDRLLIKNDEALHLILGDDIEPEYFYTEDEVIELLSHGTLEQLMDTLEFGTDGVIDLVKQYAVELEIPDIRMRNLIREKTGFDVTKAIEIDKEYENYGAEAQAKERKANPVEAKPSKPARAAAPVVSKYRTISK